MVDANNTAQDRDRPNGPETQEKAGPSDIQPPPIPDAPEETAIELREDSGDVEELEAEPEELPPDASSDMTSQESAQVISQLQEGNRKLHDKLLRARADFENFKKRHEREKADQIQAARKVIFRELLDIMDNFERALDSAEDESNPFVVGVKMIYRQFRDFMSQNDVQEINALGEEFNPHLHEAMAQQATAEVPENTVIEIFQKGYQYRNRLLRPAQVKVAIRLDNGNDVDSDKSATVEQSAEEN